MSNDILLPKDTFYEKIFFSQYIVLLPIISCEEDVRFNNPSFQG
jgi:hypothetical protein